MELCFRCVPIRGLSQLKKINQAKKTVTGESLPPTIDAAALQETIGQIRAGHDDLEKHLHEMFRGLGELADELAQRQRAADGDRRMREAEFCRREEQLKREREELETTFQRIQDLTRQVSAPVAADSEAAAQMERILSGAEQERAALLSALQATGSQNSQWGRMAEELAAARHDLATAREEIRAQRELLERAASGQASAEDSEVRPRLAELEQEQIAWLRERAVLETELDSVRNRAAELAGALEEERRRVAEERKGWAEELRRMRRLLETLADRPSPAALPWAGAPPVQAAQPVAAPMIVARGSDEESSANDPVLDSVMAQFEILQKDLARRRKARPAVQLGS